MKVLVLLRCTDHVHRRISKSPWLLHLLLLLAVQTLQSCFDGGEPGSSLIRRCLTMRNATTPALDCPSPFKDFRLAFYGRSE